MLCIPITLFLSFLFVYWYSSDFWMYIALLNRANSNIEIVTDESGRTVRISRFNKPKGTSNKKSDMDLPSGTAGDISPDLSYNEGPGGLNLIKIDSMTGSFYKDYLEIVRDHCNWMYMSDKAHYVESNGEKVLPTVDSILGITASEVGVDTAGNIYAPKTALYPNMYNKKQTNKNGTTSPAYTLYNVTSEWFRDFGIEFVNDHDGLFTKTYFQNASDAGKDYNFTQFQFMKSYFSKFPAGDIIPEYNPYTEPYSLPSTLSTGYKQDKSKERGWNDRDVVYFPDQISETLALSYGSLADSVNGSDLTENGKKAVGYLSYTIHHNGNAGVVAVGKNINSGEDLKSNFTDAVNQMGNIIAGIQNYFTAHGDDLIKSQSFNFDGYEGYYGMGVICLLNEGGFFRTESQKQRVLNFLKESNEFKSGASIACEILGMSGGAEAAINVVSNAPVRDISQEAGYGFIGPNENLSGGSDTGSSKYLPIYIESRYNYDYGSGSRKAIHYWGPTDIRGVIKASVMGPYLYYRMLQAAGVACTFSEIMTEKQSNVVVSNSNGSINNSMDTIISEAPSVPEINTSTSISYGGEYSDFYHGVSSIYNSDGSVNENKIDELNHVLTQEVIGEDLNKDIFPTTLDTWNWPGYSNSGDYLINARFNGTLCNYHMTKFYDMDTSLTTGTLESNGKETTGLHYLQCTWWACARAREYIDKVVQDPNMLDIWQGTGWGNGSAYGAAGRSAGFKVVSGSEMVSALDSISLNKACALANNTTSSAWGHVYFIEAVDRVNKNIYISEASAGNSWRGIHKVSYASGTIKDTTGADMDNIVLFEMQGS